MEQRQKSPASPNDRRRIPVQDITWRGTTLLLPPVDVYDRVGHYYSGIAPSEVLFQILLWETKQFAFFPKERFNFPYFDLPPHDLLELFLTVHLRAILERPDLRALLDAPAEADPRWLYENWFRPLEEARIQTTHEALRANSHHTPRVLCDLDRALGVDVDRYAPDAFLALDVFRQAVDAQQTPENARRSDARAKDILLPAIGTAPSVDRLLNRETAKLDRLVSSATKDKQRVSREATAGALQMVVGKAEVDKPLARYLKGRSPPEVASYKGGAHQAVVFDRPLRDKVVKIAGLQYRRSGSKKGGRYYDAPNDKGLRLQPEKEPLAPIAALSPAEKRDLARRIARWVRKFRDNRKKYRRAVAAAHVVRDGISLRAAQRQFNVPMKTVARWRDRLAGHLRRAA
ncbi:MAG: hypothetical protein V2A79_02745 [Planctomycetota bacterium]